MISAAAMLWGLAALSLGMALMWRSMPRRWLPALFIAMTLMAVAWYQTPESPAPGPAGAQDAAPNAVRPVAVAGEGDAYASSKACLECHPQQHASWHASYHRTMTQLVTPASVQGDFGDVEARVYGHQVRLERRGDEFWAQMQDPERRAHPQLPTIDRQVVLSTGSHHMQVYWYATGKDRRLAQLPLVWLGEDRRWVPVHSIFIRPTPSEAGRSEARWNNTCIKCHTTHGRPRIHPQRQPQVDTHVAEFGIACEACHGPGAAHVAAQRAGQGGTARLAHPLELGHQRGSEICGQCHGVWTAATEAESQASYTDGWTYRPGDRLAETRHVFESGQEVTPHIADYLREEPHFHQDRFWQDGMVRVSGREFNGLIRSPCYQQGELSCMSCHQLHPEPDHLTQAWRSDQLGPKMETNTACTQCHEAFREPAALAAHTHHSATSSGSQCYNCHMPLTTYGLLKAIRAHEITSPSTQTTLQTGRPNACNQCHLDQTLPWVAHHLESWYDIQAPEWNGAQPTVAQSLREALSGDAGQRALAAYVMGWEPALSASRTDWIAPVLGQLLLDPYDAVRYIAQRSLRKQPGFADFRVDFLAPESVRRQRSQAVYAQWQKREPGSAAPQLLLEADGDLRHEEFLRLLQARDDRVVALAE